MPSSISLPQNGGASTTLTDCGVAPFERIDIHPAGPVSTQLATRNAPKRTEFAQLLLGQRSRSWTSVSVIFATLKASLIMTGGSIARLRGKFVRGPLCFSIAGMASTFKPTQSAITSMVTKLCASSFVGKKAMRTGVSARDPGSLVGVTTHTSNKQSHTESGGISRTFGPRQTQARTREETNKHYKRCEPTHPPVDACGKFLKFCELPRHHHLCERSQKDTPRCVSVSVKRRSERAFPKPYWRLWCALPTYNHHLTGREYHQTFRCTTHGKFKFKSQLSKNLSRVVPGRIRRPILFILQICTSLVGRFQNRIVFLLRKGLHVPLIIAYHCFKEDPRASCLTPSVSVFSLTRVVKF